MSVRAFVGWKEEWHGRGRGLPSTYLITHRTPQHLHNTNQHHVVNWIDSKAMYGSRETYLSEVLPQVTRYVNRFGPGCVIFWWGFDYDGIGALPSAQHHHVVLLDDFPPRPREGQLVFLGGGGGGCGGVR